MDFNIGVLQEDSLAPYLFIIYPDYVLLTSISLINENGFTLKKGKEQLGSLIKLLMSYLRHLLAEGLTPCCRNAVDVQLQLTGLELSVFST